MPIQNWTNYTTKEIFQSLRKLIEYTQENTIVYDCILTIPIGIKNQVIKFLKKRGYRVLGKEYNDVMVLRCKIGDTVTTGIIKK